MLVFFFNLLHQFRVSISVYFFFRVPHRGLKVLKTSPKVMKPTWFKFGLRWNAKWNKLQHGILPLLTSSVSNKWIHKYKFFFPCSPPLLALQFDLSPVTVANPGWQWAFRERRLETEEKWKETKLYIPIKLYSKSAGATILPRGASSIPGLPRGGAAGK